MSLKNDTLPNEFWKHLGKFDLTDYAQPRWSILVNDNGLQCTLYWSVPGATPPSPPASPEKEEAENKLEDSQPADGQTDTAKTIQALLQHRIQQLQQNNKQYMRNQLPIGNTRPGMKRKESPQAPKTDPDSQVPKRQCVNPPMCSSPNSLALATQLTPSVSASSNNSASPNQSSNNEDGTLLIDEGVDERDDDDSIEDILKKKPQQPQLPHIPKNLAHNLQAQIQQATKSLQLQQSKVDMASLLSKASHLNNLKLAQRMGGNRMLSSAQQLLSSLNNSVGNQSDIKDEADSDLEEIMCDGDSDMDSRGPTTMSMMLKAQKSSPFPGVGGAGGAITPSQGQFGMGPPTGATRPKMEAFISERNKMMDLELLRQRFSNPLARPTLTKFVYALTRLLFTDEEIIAPLRDLDQEKIDWIFDETYRMFPGCTYPTVKNAVGQVGRTKRYRAKYALGAKDGQGGGRNDAFDSLNTSANNSAQSRSMLSLGSVPTSTNSSASSFNMLQGLPSLLANLPPQLTQAQLTNQMQSIMAQNGTNQEMTTTNGDKTEE